MADIPLGSVGPSMQCDVCGCRLNNFEQWKGNKLQKITWEHTGLFPEGWTEHDPVPVVLPENEIPRVGFCDFCNSDQPVWGFPTAPFQIATMAVKFTPTGTDALGWGSCDNWAACQECKDNIEALNWDKIEKRYLSHKAVPKHLRSVLRQDIRILHRQFRLHRIGPPYKTVRTEGPTKET